MPTVDADTVIVPLTRGLVAVVDSADADPVCGHNWIATAHGKKRRYSYAARHVGGRLDGFMVYMHRLIAGATRGQRVDHVDGDSLNNRRSNLRIVTAAQNNANSRSHGGASKYKGVSPSPHGNGKWVVQISFEKRRYCIGTFDTEVEAAEAYNWAAIRIHGEFARLNEIGER